jgi:phosphoesterase RecJ-like protein
VDGTERIVLTTHMNADGDAIGSQTGFARFLLSRGKEVTVVNQEPTPANLEFLLPAELPFQVYDPTKHDRVLEATERIVLLDNSAPDRFGTMEPLLRRLAGQALCIDHHPTRGTPWDRVILDTDACATAALIYELTTGAGWVPDPRSAEALYAGIATDTGFFRFNSTNAQGHRIAASLLDLGVDPARCYREVHERTSPSYTRLLGMALAGMRSDAGGAVVSVGLTREMIHRASAGDVDTSEMTTPMLATDGVRIALLFREMDGGRIKVSLRSKGSLDVYELATEFGGGGHPNASGIVTDGELGDVMDRVIARATDLVASA